MNDVILDELQLQRRKPVWIAFSEFFLDTSLDDEDLWRIARIASDSGYSLSVLQDIYLCEVAPAVGLNLLSIAGEWAGFEEVELCERCLARAKHRSWFVRCFAFVHRRFWFLTYLGDISWHRMVRRLRRLPVSSV